MSRLRAHPMRGNAPPSPDRHAFALGAGQPWFPSEGPGAGPRNPEA